MGHHVGRLHLITDARPGRDVLATVAAALAAGVDTVRVQVPREVPDRVAHELAAAVVELCRPRGASCVVHSRLHIALAVGAAGGQVGPDDLPVVVARRLLGPTALLGVTVRDLASAGRAVRDGADYIGVGPVYPSAAAATATAIAAAAVGSGDGQPIPGVSVPGVPIPGVSVPGASVPGVWMRGVSVPMGPDGVAAVAAAVAVPVIAVGGVSAERIAALRAAGAYGVAVAGAVSVAADPSAAVAQLSRALA